MLDVGLLELLSEDWQPGPALARRLGVSRQAVHQAARKLAAEGYPVEHGPLGFRLAPGAPAPQLLLPRLRGRFGRAYRYLGRVASTQDALRTWAETGAPEGALVLAETQTAGRGRQGRRWESPGGGLYFSLLLRPRTGLGALPLLPLAAGVGLAWGLGVGGLKWPNDLLDPRFKKLAGVLLEAEVLGEEVRHVLLGVGINVEPRGLPPGAAALKHYFPEARRHEVLARVLLALEHALPLVEDKEALADAWRRAALTLGRRVRVRWVGGVLEGLAEDLREDGALVLRLKNGKRKAVTAGDVELVRTEVTR